MQIKLEKVKAIVSDLMVDKCQIFLITYGSFNETTGLYTEVEEVVYNGKCMFWGPRDASENDDFYTFAVPISVPLVPKKAWVRLTKCVNDSKKVGQVFEVLDCTMDTYDAYRTVSVAHRAEPRP